MNEWTHICIFADDTFGLDLVWLGWALGLRRKTCMRLRLRLYTLLPSGYRYLLSLRLVLFGWLVGWDWKEQIDHWCG